MILNFYLPRVSQTQSVQLLRFTAVHAIFTNANILIF